LASRVLILIKSPFANEIGFKVSAFQDFSFQLLFLTAACPARTFFTLGA
jgi:hypothetical protein